MKTSAVIDGNFIMTSEEKSAGIYIDNDFPTVPRNVSSTTSLESLNLNWREKDLPEKERTKHVHRLHPYLGKFIPQIVEIFLRKYFKPGQVILDPFCGSGTTLVQANELKINSIGYDISEFNVLLSKVKTAKYDLDLLYKEILDAVDKLRSMFIKHDDQLSLLEDDLIAVNDKEYNEYLNKWFAPRALKQLLAYKYLIENEGYQYSDLLKIILSRSARSARLTTHFDLDFPKKPQTEPYYCYKHSRICKPTDEAYKFLRRYSLDTFRRIEEFQILRTDAKVDVYHQDSRDAKIPKIDGVITSPPYVGLIDYHEQHAYSYHLFGFKDNREKEIGPASNGSSLRAKEEYQKDISDVFRNIHKSLKRGGRVIVVAGDKSDLYGKIAEMSGFKIESTVQRHVNRRTGRRSTDFFESVFVWKK